MANPDGQIFKPVIIQSQPALPLNPPRLADFVTTQHLTLERLTKILSTIPDSFLMPREIDLLIHVLSTRQAGLAFLIMNVATSCPSISQTTKFL